MHTPTRLPFPGVTLAAVGLLALNLVGGGLAVALHVNTFVDAFGSKAEMAAPWPTLLLMVAGGLAAARWRGWRGVLGTLAVAVPCVLALLSTGDDETFRSGLPLFTYVFQVAVLVAFGLALVPCALHLRGLRRPRALAV